MNRVWVVGSINVDTVLRVAHLPRPGETAAGTSQRGLGGKGANQAVAAARAGATVMFGGAVGTDDAGDDALAQLTNAGVDVSRVARRDGPTGSAFVMVDDAGENAIVVVAGANGEVSIADVSALPFVPGDVVVAQGELGLDVTVAALAAARAAGATTIWNPAPADPTAAGHLDVADVVVVNEIELATLAGDGPVPTGVARLVELGACSAVATLGPDGVVAWHDGATQTYPAAVADVVDTTGAGDCFVGVFAAGLAAGQAFDDAVETAVVAAGLAVGRVGAAGSMPTGAEIAFARLTP